MAKGMHQQKLAVESGHWPLYRYDPKLEAENKNPFQLDSSDPKIPLKDYIYTEGRYRMLQQSDPEVAKFLLGQAEKAVHHRWQQYTQMATTRNGASLKQENAYDFNNQLSGHDFEKPDCGFFVAAVSQRR